MAEIYSLRKERGKEGRTKSGGTHLAILTFITILFAQIIMCLRNTENVASYITEDHKPLKIPYYSHATS